MTYDENSIRVLSPEESERRFDWLRLEETLAREHNLPVDWVRRAGDWESLLEAIIAEQRFKAFTYDAVAKWAKNN